MITHLAAPGRIARRHAAAIALAGLGAATLSPNAHAGFSAEGSVQNITLTALDANGQPAGDGAFSLSGTGDPFAWLTGATTTNQADPWADVRTADAVWNRTGTSLPPVGLAVQLAQSGTGFGYQSQVNASGLSVQAQASGVTRDLAVWANLGSQRYGQNVVSLAPHTTLQIDATVSYALHQDGLCIGKLCDAAFLLAGVLTYGDGWVGGNAVVKAIAPVAVDTTAYGSFVAQQLGQLSGSEHVSGWLFNDSDVWANQDFYISLETIGASVDFVPAVPEPSSWALMLCGLGIVGRLVKRQRTQGQCGVAGPHELSAAVRVRGARDTAAAT